MNNGCPPSADRFKLLSYHNELWKQFAAILPFRCTIAAGKPLPHLNTKIRFSYRADRIHHIPHKKTGSIQNGTDAPGCLLVIIQLSLVIP